MATFELKIFGEIDELAGIANRIAGAPDLASLLTDKPTELQRAAADNGYTVAGTHPEHPSAVAPAGAKAASRTRKTGAAAMTPSETNTVPTLTADAATPAATSASPTEASSSAGSAETASPPAPTPASEQPKPEAMTHPDQLLGADVTPDMLKDAMTDALSKRLIPAAKVQGALKEATGGVASLTALWALPADADRAAKAAAAYAALIALQA